MHPLMLEIVPWVRQGYCCSQLLIVLLLQALQRESPELVRACRGLGYGIGQSNGPCGLLTGGACALAFLVEDGNNATLQSVLNEYAMWFEERVAPYGSSSCFSVAEGLGGESRHPDLMACGDLLCECWEKIVSLGQNYELF